MKKLLQALLGLTKLLNGAMPGLREQNQIWRELYEELKGLVAIQREERKQFQQELLRLEKLLNQAFHCPHRQECPVLR